MKKIFAPVFVLLSVFLAMSCQEKPAPQEKTFAIYADNGSLQREVQVSSHGRTLKMRMLSSADWRVAAQPEWLVTSPESGTSANRFLNLTISENVDKKAREGQIEFFMEEEPVYRLTVRQAAHQDNDIVIPEPEPQPDRKGKRADLLDVVFSANGEARDISRQALPVRYLPSFGVMNYYDPDFKMNVACFKQDGSRLSEGYYRVDYLEDEAFVKCLRDGHSMEMVFYCNQTPDGSREVKMFSSHEAGGTGFLISNNDRGNCITFLPNVSKTGTSNWIWTQSGVTPEAGKLYHVIGVWDKVHEKSSIYVNGRLCGETSAPGELVMPSVREAWWFGVGTDSSPEGGQSCLDGGMVLARIYDDPLTAAEVSVLYEDVQQGVEAERASIGTVEYLADCHIPPRYWYHLFGSNFQSGDKIRFVSRSDSQVAVECEGRIGQEELAVQIPADMQPGDYNLLLMRAGKPYPVGPVKLTVGQSSGQQEGTRCVAHRCYHQNGSRDRQWPENSLAALQRTQDLGVWGAEIDVWITKDDVVLVNHNSSFPTDPSGRQIQHSYYADFKEVRLSNGEPVPTLESFLKQLKQKPGLTLVLEVKSHSRREDMNRVVDKCIEMVQAMQLEDRVSWIAFDYESCKRVAKALPSALVQYLGGNRSPKQCSQDGVMGIDYAAGKMTDEWIAEAHGLGMKVNVWTINDVASMTAFIARGVDFITTDHPEVLKNLLSRQFVTAN